MRLDNKHFRPIYPSPRQARRARIVISFFALISLIVSMQQPGFSGSTVEAATGQGSPVPTLTSMPSPTPTPGKYPTAVAKQPPANYTYYDIRENFSAERVFGPITVVFAGMNPLRQATSATTTIALLTPPPVSSVFSVAGGGAAQAAAPAASSVPGSQNFTAPSSPADQLLGELTLLIKSLQQVSNLSLTQSSELGACEKLRDALRSGDEPKSRLMQLEKDTLTAIIVALNEDSTSETRLDQALTKRELMVLQLLDTSLKTAGQGTSCDPTDPQQINPPGGSNIAPCVEAFRNGVLALQSKLQQAALHELTLVLRSDAILNDNPDLTSSAGLEKYQQEVNKCIFHSDAVNVTPPLVRLAAGEYHCPRVLYDGSAWQWSTVSDVVAEVDSLRKKYIAYQNAATYLSLWLPGSPSPQGSQPSQPTVVVNISKNGAGNPKPTPSARVTPTPKPGPTMSPDKAAQFNAVLAILNSDASAMAAVTSYSDNTLRNLTISSFIYAKPQTCDGLLSFGSTNQIVLAVSGQTATAPNAQASSGAGGAAGGPGVAASPPAQSAPATAVSAPGAANSSGNQTYDVTVVCRTKAFLSAGVGYDWLSNASYTYVPPNKPSPMASATLPPGSIAESNVGGRVVVYTIANLALHIPALESSNGSGPFFSAGLGIPVSNVNNFTADGLFGVSYAFNRSFVVTGGGAVGEVKTLPNGYSTSKPVYSSTIPTITSTRFGWFAGFSFGY